MNHLNEHNIVHALGSDALLNGDWNAVLGLLKDKPKKKVADASPFVKEEVRTTFTTGTLDFKIVNDTVKQQRVSLFGANEMALATNFGNPAGVTINFLAGRYSELLAKNQNTVFEVNIMRMQSENDVQLFKKFDVTQAMPTGSSQQRRLGLGVGFVDTYRQQSNIAQIYETFKIDAYTKIEFDLLPKTEVAICFFLSQKSVKPVQDFAEPQNDYEAFDGMDFIQDKTKFTDDYGKRQ